MKANSVNEIMEDHALEVVPQEQRQGWLQLTWNTAGIVTTLIQIFFGALATFVAGFKIALIAGVVVTLVGGLLGWACGHIAFKSGLSSTVMARKFGFGKQGSIVASAIFGFMIIGFLALENALLYEGALFFFGIEDSLINQILIYGLLTLTWVFLTLFGFKLVSKVSSVALILFLLLLGYMTWFVLNKSGVTLQQATSFQALLPLEVLTGMNASTTMGKFIFCINLFIGSAGALALVDADLGRYAKSSKDIGIAAFLGNIAMDIIMVAFGGIVMYAASKGLVTHYIGLGMDEVSANQKALSPDGVAAAFILFGGIIGVFLMVFAQAKAQVLNTYSGSLSLTNLFDVVGLRMPRFWMVILANILALVMIASNILGLVNSWITILGVLTTSFAGIMIADYYIIRKGGKLNYSEENINISGIITTVVATVNAHYIFNSIISIEFITSIVTSIVLYTFLRNYVFKIK